jgi:primosomal protein N'
MTQRYLEVALPVPLRSAFTYAVPSWLDGEELVGRRVLVPFRNRAMIGVGLAVFDEAPKTKRLKEIAELLDRVPALPPKLIELGQWISRYYLAPIGEAFRAMLPPEIELRHHREYWLTNEGRAYLQDLVSNEENTDVEAAELKFLRRFEKEKADAPERALTETRVARLTGGVTAAEKFVRRGQLADRESTRHRKTRTQKIVAWNVTNEAAPANLSRPAPGKPAGTKRRPPPAPSIPKVVRRVCLLGAVPPGLIWLIAPS